MKHGDGHGHLALGDQVVEDGGHEARVAAAVLKDHDASGLVVLVLRGDVDPPLARVLGKIWLSQGF